MEFDERKYGVSLPLIDRRELHVNAKRSHSLHVLKEGGTRVPSKPR